MPRLRAYHRPATLDEALELLARPDVTSAPLGGGTCLSVPSPSVPDEVVDLQALGLDVVSVDGGHLDLGAMVRLQTLVDHERVPPLLRMLAHREHPNTLRNAVTVGGLVAGRAAESALLAGLLVHEAVATVAAAHGTRTIELPTVLRDGVPAGAVITSVRVSWDGETAVESTARTPADLPIVAAAARRRNDGAILLALSGVATTPILVAPSEVAAVDPPGDFRGSPGYRRHLAVTLTRRVLARLPEETSE
jgi:CO/xanthine dehydrogenase FAD-binding subunit